MHDKIKTIIYISNKNKTAGHIKNERPSGCIAHQNTHFRDFSRLNIPNFETKYTHFRDLNIPILRP